MKHILSLAITGVLLASSVSAQDQQPQPAHVRIEDTPEFKQLTPEQQKLISAIPDGPEKDADFVMILSSIQHPSPAQAAPPPAPKAQPCKPPKPPSFLDRLKLRAEGMVIQQAARIDGKISKDTKGTVNGTATDAAITAAQQANQPCKQ